MEQTITLDMLLDLPNTILNKSKEYNEYAELLRPNECINYNCKELRNSIEEKFNHFKNIKYFCKFSIESNINISQNMELKESCRLNHPSDSVGNLVEKSIDELLWGTEFYNRMLLVAPKLTMQEITYFIDTFFKHKSEEVISEQLGICKNTLLVIKKSCLVKVWIEIQDL